MSNYESQHEIDDELLSAYLDEELSPEERAAVESRLAQDPVAREILHQLRTVSQAVQALPHEVVGHNLGEAVLRRVASGGPPSLPTASTATDGEPTVGDRATSLGSPLPKLTIGRTRRGWVWASLAIAAALLVMVFQPDREGEEKLAPVAMREEQVVREERGPATAPRGELELRALNQNEPSQAPSDMETSDLAASAAPNDGAASRNRQQPSNMPAEPAARPSNDEASQLRVVADDATTQIARGGAARPTTTGVDTTSNTATPPNLSRSTTAERAADSAAVDSLSTSPRGAAIGQMTEELADVPAQDEQPVVVRVLARREALENKAFDRLLESHGIEVDSESTAAASAPAARALSESQPVEQSEVERLRENAAQEPMSGRDEDVVLVDAPAALIASSLETLSADNVNYLGIKIEEAATPPVGSQLQAGATAEYSPPEQEALMKRQAVSSDWTRYNRGVIPESEARLNWDKHYFYQHVDEGTDRYGTERGIASGYSGASGLQPAQQRAAAQQGQPVDRKELGERNLGRALRLRSWGIQDQSQVEQLGRRRFMVREPSSEVNLQLAESSRELRQQVRSESDRMQVLFVISAAEEPASSPPARNKAQ